MHHQNFLVKRKEKKKEQEEQEEEEQQQLHFLFCEKTYPITKIAAFYLLRRIQKHFTMS
jgi:hypothetical protein